MPTWLYNALITMLIIWTVWEVLTWSAAIYHLTQMQPWQRVLIKFGKIAWVPTLIVIICWIILICYWLR